MSNELSKELSKKTRTPIEIALEMTEDGMVSAKKLYEFLELAPSQYARWCKDNILENPLVDENVDFKPFRHDVENPLGGRPSDDYLLTVEFAKELCMTCRSEKGRLAREYFKKTEQALVISVKQYKELMNTTTLLTERVEQLGKLVEDKNTEVLARLDVLESSSVIANDEGTEWARTMQPRVNALAERYTNGDSAKCMDRLIERAEELGMPDSYDELKAYYATHHDGKRAKKILIMAQFEESRDAFEMALKEKEKEWGLYKQTEQQKRFEQIMDGFVNEIVPDAPEPRRMPTDEELAEQWADMDKMYGPGWDKQDNYPLEGTYGD